MRKRNVVQAPRQFPDLGGQFLSLRSAESQEQLVHVLNVYKR